MGGYQVTVPPTGSGTWPSTISIVFSIQNTVFPFHQPELHSIHEYQNRCNFAAAVTGLLTGQVRHVMPDLTTDRSLGTCSGTLTARILWTLSNRINNEVSSLLLRSPIILQRTDTQIPSTGAFVKRLLKRGEGGGKKGDTLLTKKGILNWKRYQK